MINNFFSLSVQVLSVDMSSRLVVEYKNNIRYVLSMKAIPYILSHGDSFGIILSKKAILYIL